MSDSVVPEVASILQSASLNRQPSPTHDINPSTAASKQEPIQISSSSPTSSASTGASIPSSALNPTSHPPKARPRTSTLPPLPELRFEQSYLASLKDANSAWDVAYITTRDQVIMPLLQGTLWTLCLSGWRYWNRSSALKGESVGAQVRRWWWGVNNWSLPADARGKARS